MFNGTAMFVITLHNLNLACQHTQWKENLKYWKQTKHLKKLQELFIPYFQHLGTFIMILLTENVHV